MNTGSIMDHDIDIDRVRKEVLEFTSVIHNWSPSDTPRGYTTIRESFRRAGSDPLQLAKLRILWTRSELAESPTRIIDYMESNDVKNSPDILPEELVMLHAAYQIQSWSRHGGEPHRLNFLNDLTEEELLKAYALAEDNHLYPVAEHSPCDLDALLDVIEQALDLEDAEGIRI